MLAAAFLGSGVAEAAGTLYASDYTGGSITLINEDWSNGKLVVNEPLTLTGGYAYLDLGPSTTIEFQKNEEAKSICSIFTSATNTTDTVYFNDTYDDTTPVFNFTFNDGAQAIVAASAGTPITLIEDLNRGSKGFRFYDTTPAGTTLKFNGAGYGETVVLDGVSFTYVGPQSSDYVFQPGEIGFTGYYEHSHALNLVANAPAVPEPTTGSLSLLALAGLCARRRRK